MKKYFGSWLFRGCLAALLLAGNAHASTLFFDNFQQFPDGMVLSLTNYVPIVGVSVNITNDSTGDNSTTVVSSNFLGNTQAFFEPGSLPYQENYEGDPTEVPTDQVVTLSFTLWIPTVKTAGHFGGVGPLLPTIAGNDGPLLWFNDDGSVVAFTNAASGGQLVPPFPFVQIGSWSALQNTVMTNVLVLNYPAGTFSFSLNGAVLTNNMPIPGFFTNYIDEVRVVAFEGDTNVDVASLGNSFALGNVLLSVPASSTNQDLSQYVAAAKGQLFDQLSSGAPTLSATGFVFQTTVTGTSSNTVLSASDQVPGSSNIVLSLSDPEMSKFKFQALFTSKPAMDAVFTNGVYLMVIGTPDEGTFTLAETLPGDDYPNPPQVLNFDAAQVINASTNFVFVWGSFTNGTTNDVISFEIDDAFGNTITNTPDIGEPGQLDGTVTNFLVPAGILIAGTTNTGYLEFIKVTTRDTNSVPGVLGVTGYSEQTQFSVVVAGTTVCVFAISPTNAIFTAAGGSGGVNITAQNGCAWSATTNDSFISITSGSSGSGNASVSYTIAANTSSNEVNGTMTIAGQTFTVVQTGVGCTFLLDSTSANFSAAGGSSNVVVTAGTNCDWMAASNNGFITITSGSTGSGNGTVSYTIAVNTNTIGQTGSMTVAGQTYTVTQTALACNLSLDSTSASYLSAGGSSNVVVTANGTNCAWTAVSNNSFITITSGSTGSGNGTVSYIVAVNTNTISQTGSMTVAGQTYTITEAAAVCNVSAASTSANFSAAGGSSNVVVTANGTNCAWTAVSNNSFITITSGASGSGNGTVSYTVAANTSSSALTGTVTIAGQTFTVTEAVPCTFSINPTNRVFTAAGGSDSVSVTAPNGCAWTAVSNNSFITITSGSSGSGNGTVFYTVAANTSINGLTGTMTIAGQTFTVTQSGASETCTHTLSATSVTLTAKGGSKNVRVKVKGTDCSWTAVSNDPFITITSGSSGAGNGKVDYTIPGNTNTTPLNGTMTIAGQTVTVHQDAGGCTFSLSPKDGKFKAAGGPATVKVKPNLRDCAWTAVSNDAFITVIGNANGFGKGTVGYAVSANTNTTTLTGSITIGGETFTVTQAGAK